METRRFSFFLSIQVVRQCATEAHHDHPFFRSGPTRVLTCLLQVCDFALVGKIFMTTSVLLKLPCLSCRPNALLAPEILSSGKCFRFVLPSLSLRSTAWCSHFGSFSRRNEWRKRQPQRKQKGKEHGKGSPRLCRKQPSPTFDISGVPVQLWRMWLMGHPSNAALAACKRT